MSFKKYDMKKTRYQEKSSDTKKKKTCKTRRVEKEKKMFFNFSDFFLNVVSFAQTFFLPRKTKLFPDPFVDIFLIRKIFFENMFEVFSKPPFTNHPLFFLMKCYDFVPQHAVNLFLEP